MTVTVKREDYEALQRAYADSEEARKAANRAVHWAGIANLVAVIGLIVAGYGFFDYFQKQNAEVAADARKVCDQAIANRETARQQDFAAVGYVDDVVAIIDEFAGIPEDLRAALIERSNLRLEEINQERPPYQPGSCPPVPLPSPSIPTSAVPTTTTTVAD